MLVVANTVCMHCSSSSIIITTTITSLIVIVGVAADVVTAVGATVTLEDDDA